MMTRAIGLVAGLAMAPAMAMAQWSDNFDAYPSNVSLNGLGGWQGWDNVAAAAGATSNAFAFSGPNSQRVQGAADSVHKYTGVNSGAWTYSAMQYIPDNVTTGATYFILNNIYNDGSPYNWSVELQFNLATNMVYDDLLGTGGGPSPGSALVPLVRNQWIPIVVSMDLTADTMSATYNGVPIIATTWKRQTGAVLDLAAVDLYANNAGAVYYDNMTLVPAPAGAVLLGMAGLAALRRRRV